MCRPILNWKRGWPGALRATWNSPSWAKTYGTITTRSLAIRVLCAKKSSAASMERWHGNFKVPSRAQPHFRLVAAGVEHAGCDRPEPVSYTHLRAHETGRNLVCRLLL